MSPHKFVLVGVSLFLLTIPAVAGVVFNNFPFGSTDNGNTISSPYTVSNSFTLGSAAVVDGVNFGVWANNGVTSVDWAIGMTKFDNSVDSGTAVVSETYVRSASGASWWRLYSASFSFAPIHLAAGTYYLTLQNATAGTIAWDTNPTPGIDAWGRGSFGDYSVDANSFQILGDPAVPEPASWAFLGSGLLAVATMKRKLLRR